jgi:hypothetical protein
MRNRDSLEQMHLTTLAKQSKRQIDSIRYENSDHEVFEFQDGELICYTDTRVINEHDDRLVNLAERPFK